MIRALGCNAPIFVAKETWNYPKGIDTNLQAAQSGLLDSSKGIYVGADMDSLLGTPYRNTAQGAHMSDTGNDALAGLWNTIFRNFF
jgi:hypothetical protein